MQAAYEDRIADMRAQVDRVTSRQLLDQEQFEQKLDRIMRRQETLESRDSSIAGLADEAITGSVGHPGSSDDRRSMLQPPKPSPISDTVLFMAPVEHHARLESRIVPSNVGRIAARVKEGGIEGVLGRLQASLDQIENSQAAVLNAMEERYDSAAQRMHRVLADLGVNPDTPHPTSGVGGPFVPIKRGSANSFQRQLYRIEVARARVQQMGETLQTVPVRQPIPGDDEITSAFGVRIDPFLGRPAMHTGLDFRAPIGNPVHATAAGTVAIAGWSGGYGKMVEIDHGHGFTTRYGHLSKLLVAAGQKVAVGQVIGEVGSTGRSTGPHLHYETRIDDEAVDPHKFLRAGVRLSGSL